jgi:large subunit ribosomal protein L25
MAEIVLTAQPGRPTGSAASRRLRATGKVPAVVYGAGVDATSVTVDWKELRSALTTEKGLNAVVTLNVDGESHMTIVKDVQRHPVRRDVLHVDFLVVERDKPVAAEVPVVLEGEPTKVLQERGVVEQLLHMLTVHAKPAAIPGSITVDVSALEIGDTITVADLPLPAGVTTDIEDDQAVATAQVTGAAAAAAAEGEEGAEEGAEGEGVEGGEPSGGDESGGE